MARILVFTATGQVGSALCDELVSQGHQVAGITRNEAAAGRMIQRGITPIVGDIRNLDQLGPKLGGFDSVFLASSDARDQDKAEMALIECLRAGGLPHMVKLSAQSAGLSPPVSFGIQHRAVEDALKHSGLSYTILRPTFFQQSLLLMSGDVAKSKAITAPMGKGRTAMVDVRDIAAVAARCLIDEGHAGKTYTLTGPAAHGFADVTEKLTHLLGAKVSYSSPPAPLARLVMPILTGMPRWKTSLLVDLMVAIRNGAQEKVTNDVMDVTGDAPRTLDAFLKEHLPSFQP
ncbi:NAD(P)H-binding protein [Hoeflea sp. AS60]|uniref:NAD(P)H-binding protein n=1 Tax=Hoeflea sp. AS60 TaxID=3135780 RepID=UPI00317AD246